MGSRCGEHQLDSGKYDSRWRSIRAQYLVAHQTCEEPGCEEPAVAVDHVDGSGPSGDNRWPNLRALCWSHHSAKTARNDGGFGRLPA